MDQKKFDEIGEDAVKLAEEWQQKSIKLMRLREKAFQKKIQKLVAHEKDRFFLNQMIDQCFRSGGNRRVGAQILYLMQRYGIPSFFSAFERFLALSFFYPGRFFPFLSVPLIRKRMIREFRSFILPGEEKKLLPSLAKRRDQGVRINLNHLGEAILGEDQALQHLSFYIDYLKKPEIENISVKISSLYSQIIPLAFDTAKSVIANRLEKLYSEAQKNPFVRADGSKVSKLVTLDMEAFKDLDITAGAFTETLDRNSLYQCYAGIALQAYLPESFAVQKKITDWAKKRIEKGGSPVKIRIVKGANLEMEKVEASIQNRPLAPYNNKLDVDANFKRMVDYGLRPENIEAVHISLGSHNIFDLAWAFLLARDRNITESPGFEMLEGMADPLLRTITKNGHNILVYAPVIPQNQFINAIAYLVRRIDENTGGENFLRYSCRLKPGSRDWNFLKKQFTDSLIHIGSLDEKSHRIQNRAEETKKEQQGTFYQGIFSNEPDTDWSLSANRAWADSVRANWKRSANDKPEKIPLVLAGFEKFKNRKKYFCYDRSTSHNDNAVCVAEYPVANEDDVFEAVETAKNDPDNWRKLAPDSRHEILSGVAAEIRAARGDLIGAAASGTGKIFSESDIEVSEAVDFAEYYPWSLKAINGIHNLKQKGKGVGLVISPWNFPIAIPCGGIVAALSAGNTVIFKPASAAILPAWHLCRCFWNAGISKKVLQFLPCPGEKTGALLAEHPDIDFIIFTGSTETGLSIFKKAPENFFTGETGGKNATIVTAMADRDQAIKNVVHSAFSNSGQKCSASSLLILEKEVFNDINFKTRLVDAAKSLKTGSAWDFETSVGPLIQPPSGKLGKALNPKQLERGETWALEPKNINNNPYLWSPGIKWNVSPGSFTHMTEFFGPVIGVICAKNLKHAVEIANQTGYGLTSGLESLDEREQVYWKETVKAGNLYINRGTTGAVVLRQPFGGTGKSAIGCGIKAGGPNYVLQFIDFKDIGFPVTGAVEKKTPLLALMGKWLKKLKNKGFEGYETEIAKTIAAIKNYYYAHEREFSGEKDYFHLRGQDNRLRYLPAGTIIVRLHENDSLYDTLARIGACIVTDCKCIISIPAALDNEVTFFLKKNDCQKLIKEVQFFRQTDNELIELSDQADRIRYAAPERVPYETAKAAASKGFYISKTRVLMEGRIELLQYLREQSICNNYHRYGNTGFRRCPSGKCF